MPAAAVLVAVRRPRYALLTRTWLVILCWFDASFRNGVVERYYLGPLLIAVSWLGAAAGIIVDILLARVGRPDATATRAGRSGLVAGLVGVALAVGLVGPAVLAAPATRARVDQSSDVRARDWSRWVLDTVDEDAVIVSWWSYSTPLWYRTLVDGERPDIWVLDDRDRLDEGLGSIDDVLWANVGQRPVYLVRYANEIAELATRWEIEEIADPRGQQPLYRVVGPRPAGRMGGASATAQARIARMGP